MSGFLGIMLANHAATAPFDPATLNLHLWLDATDASTLFEDEAHTNAAEDTDVILAMLNKGSAGNYFTVAANGPTYHASGGTVNGPHLKFDGVNDTLLSIADFSAHATTSEADIFYACVVTTIETDSGTPTANDGLWSANDGYAGLYLRTSAPRVFGWNFDGNFDAASAGTTYTAGGGLVAHYRHYGGELMISVNGGAFGTAVASGDMGFPEDNIRLGPAVNFGGSAFCEHEFVAMMARKTILDATELANAKTYLGNLVGLSL
jgi:hypothetical protein